MITILQIRIKLVGFYLYLQIYGLKTLFVNMIEKNVKTENRPILYFLFRVKKVWFFQIVPRHVFMSACIFLVSFIFESFIFYYNIYKG